MRPERGKPYVCVDVDLPRHEKVERLSDPAHGLGLWLALTCYVRETLPETAIVPKRYAERLWGNPKNRKLLGEMVSVDLLKDVGDHYEVLRYAPRNQTKGMVAEAKAKTREKVAKSRKEAASRNQDVTGYGGGQKPFPSISTSVVLSGSQGEGPGGRTPGLVRLTDPLPTELREAARLHGMPDSAIEDEWKSFVGRNDGQILPSVSGYWQTWVMNGKRRLAPVAPRKANGRALVQGGPKLYETSEDVARKAAEGGHDG